MHADDDGDTETPMCASAAVVARADADELSTSGGIEWIVEERRDSGGDADDGPAMDVGGRDVESGAAD
jgi:hypothetical protein